MCIQHHYYIPKSAKSLRFQSLELCDLQTVGAAPETTDAAASHSFARDVSHPNDSEASAVSQLGDLVLRSARRNFSQEEIVRSEVTLTP